MKTTEFIKKVKSLGFDIEELEGELLICNDDDLILTIDNTRPFVIDTNFGHWDYVGINYQVLLFSIATEFAATPINQRGTNKFFLIAKSELWNKPYLRSADEWYELTSAGFAEKFTLEEKAELELLLGIEFKAVE